MSEELIPIFRVDRARDVTAWYGRLGFEVKGEHQFETGFPLYVFLQRGDVHRDRSPQGRIYTVTALAPDTRTRRTIMSFARFMAGPIGRGIRVIAGLVMIVAGLVIGSAGGYVLAAVGLLPLLAGLFNVCVIAPVLKAPFSGKACLAEPR